ncbi:MAG: hypothetical protein WD894_21655 [Pirellulales bacterium]
MRILNCTFALAILFLLSSLGAGQEAPALPPELVQAKSVSAQQDITLVFHPEFPISLEAANEIIQSKHLASAAINELTGARTALTSINDGGRLQGNRGTQGWRVLEPAGMAYFAYLSRRQQLISGESDDSIPLRVVVAVTGPADQGEAEAEKYAALVIKHLNNVVAELSRRAIEHKLERLKSSTDEARNAAELAAEQLQEIRAKVSRQSSVFSEPVLQELVSDLKKQQQALEVELAGMKGRAEALQVEVAKTAKRAEKDPPNDDVLQNLFRVIELRKEQLAAARDLYKANTVRRTDVANAEEQVALAQVELAQAKRSASRPANEHLDKLNDELSHIFVNMAETVAKLEYVKQRLEEHLEMLKQEAETKPLREQLDDQAEAVALLQARANHAAMQVRQLQSSYRPARVEIFDLKTSDDKPANTEKAEKR